MTPYQRGCRDALLDLAAQLDKRADLYDAGARKTCASRGYNDRDPTHYGMYVRALGQAMSLRDARDLARALAERLPDDPNDSTPKE